MHEESNQTNLSPLKKVIDGLASLELTIISIVLLVLLVLAGAWIPQESTVDQAALLAKYGTDGMAMLKNSGLLNVYASTPFLAAVGLLFVNLMACTVARMAPRIRRRLRQQDFYDSETIASFKEVLNSDLPLSTSEASSFLHTKMRDLGYHVCQRDNQFIFEKGRSGWLAAPITHLGLFVLLAGVAITATTSYSGRFTLMEGEATTLSEHIEKKPLFGTIPEINIKLLSTRREDNKDGSPKQWHSKLSMTSPAVATPAEPEISVNNPSTFNNVDFNQSDWKIAGVRVLLADNDINVPTEEMGHDSMGVVPISDKLMMVLALKDANAPLRVYFKHSQSNMPKLFTSLTKGETTKDCPLPVKYEGTILSSGIQFKSDPGLPVTYASFFILMIGAFFVAMPSQRIWGSISETACNRSQISIGFSGLKALNMMKRDLRQIERSAKELSNTSECERLEVGSLDS